MPGLSRNWPLTENQPKAESVIETRSMAIDKMSFKGKWILFNTLAMLISYLFYTPIAHGMTGAHEHDMTSEQIVAHCIAHAFVALILFISQRQVLKEYIDISWRRIVLSIIVFLGLFYFGYYQEIIPGGLDTDILFGYLALGSGLWIGIVPFKGNELATIVAILSFPFASFIGELILFMVVTNFNIEFDAQSSVLHHSIFWVAVGVTTGLLGGWIGGQALSRILIAGEGESK